MVPAFFRMLRHFPRRRLRIAAQGFARPYRTPCVFVGNNEYSTELFSFGRRHHLDRGELWFYVVKPRNPLEFLLMVCRLCFGHMEQARDLDTFRLKRGRDRREDEPASGRSRWRGEDPAHPAQIPLRGRARSG